MTSSSSAQAPPRQVPSFNTSSATAQEIPKDEVESPSVSAPHALARFEFESGRGNEGTKILMVEWDSDEQTRDGTGEWHITWEGMLTVLPAAQRDTARIEDAVEGGGADAATGDKEDAAQQTAPSTASTTKKATIAERGGSHRMYFLLQPGVAVPPIVTLTYRPATHSSASQIVWHTNPLPAIFPPELGASARTAGKKGVLHTIWAKQRIRTLQREIEEESASNVESVGLTMAVQEQEWIEENFGVSVRPSGAALPLSLQTVEGVQNAPRSPGPASPRSPGGSRLQQKLQGLRLGTSAGELSSSRQESRASEAFPGEQNPLSPETGDVAVSSFAAIKGSRSAPPSESLSSLAAKPAQQPQHARKITPARPPEAVLRQQESMGGGSLNSFGGFQSMLPSVAPAHGSKDDDEDLFALPMSPRSPEMSKSPFSFASDDKRSLGQALGGGAS